MGCNKPGPLPDYQVADTLVDSCLVPSIDAARQLLTEFGLRPYRVFLVWVGWTTDENADGLVSGEELDLDPGVEGTGRAVLLKEVELLPTPLVENLGSVNGTVRSTGTTESGVVTVSQISVGYTEDQLNGLISEFRDPKYPDTLRSGVSFFWEIQEHRPSGYKIPGTAAAAQFSSADFRSPRRRFHPNAVPERKSDAFEWKITLIRADGERGRNGEMQGVDGL